MNLRLAPLRSPVALLTGLALLCAALAGVLASAGRADAAVTVLGKYTLSPATGKTTDPLMAASATAGTGCPASTNPLTPLKPSLWLLNPANANVGKQVARSTAEIESGTTPFTVTLEAAATPTSLETALRTYVKTETLDGTYTLALLCQSGLTTSPRFLAKVSVVGDTWTLLEQQATTLSLGATTGVAVGGDLRLTATLVPATAAGSVEFRDGDTPLGTVDVSGGTAALAVKAPAIGGPHGYTAAFTPADADAYSAAEGRVTADIGYLVTAEDAAGDPLGDKPVLAIGQRARITVRGFTPGATVEVSQENATGASFPDATADADGTVTDYAFTVPDRTISGETSLYFQEGGSATHKAVFTFTATDEEPGEEPTDPADLDVTDEDGDPLDPDPRLEPGQTVRITARGYPAGAAVEVTLADSEETFAGATADADGTVEKYAFTVPEKIEDGAHTLTLAEAGDTADGHSVAFAFTTGEEASPSPDPSGSSSTDPAGQGGGTGGDGTGQGGAGATTGGTGAGTGTTGGTMASTGAQAGALALTALALLSAGAALVLHVRRKGLLSFAADLPRHR